MSIIITAVEVIGGTAGMALICHRLEQVFLARKGYDTRDFFRPIRGPATPPAIEPVVNPVLWTPEQERQSARMFIDNPLAFWLDPNLWGDDPDWMARLFPAPPKPPYLDAPPTPPAIDDETPRWPDGLPIAPLTVPINPQSTFRMVMESGKRVLRSGPIDAKKEALARKALIETGVIRVTPPAELPCGCPGDGPIGGGRQPYLGYPFTVCYRCMAEWEPPSNDPTGRRLGQGESVNRATYEHGVCPEEECHAPCKLETRYHTPFYHCTSPICPKHLVGWSVNGSQWVRGKNGWRPKRSPEEIRRRNNLLANRDDYDNEMPPPPRR